MTTDRAMSRDEIIAFLDEYRAAETFGNSLFEGWASTCKVEALRGALRVMALRERSHAQVLEQRLRELGGTPKHVVSDPAQQQASDDLMSYLSARNRSDQDKAREFVRIAPPDDIVAQLSKYADGMSGDPESQALLRTIIEDERATLFALRAAAEARA